MSNFFTQELSRQYDERNAKMAAVANNMHFLSRLLLQKLPAEARVLCVGVGTGAEILSLARAFPGWTFHGVDPSAPMLEVCRERLRAARVLERCELQVGYVQDAPDGPAFDAGLSILVGHFVKRDDRLPYYAAMVERLRPGGFLVNTEISADLGDPGFGPALEGWEALHRHAGATPEALASLPDQIRNVLSVLPPSEVEQLIKRAGVPLPVPFFQSLLIRGWFGQKTSA